MAHIVGVSALQIGHRQVKKILLVQQHRHALIIDIEKILQVRKFIGLPYLFNTGKGDRHAISLGEREHQFGLQRSFDVQVQLRLGQRVDQGGVAHRPCPSPARKMIFAPALLPRISSSVRPLISCGKTSQSSVFSTK